MRDRLLEWLSFYAIITLFVSLLISFALQTISMRREFKQTVSAKIDESYMQSRQAKFTSFELKTRVGNYAVSLANAVAVLIQGEPSILRVDPSVSDARADGLGKLCERLGLCEIDVVDGNGFIIAAYPSSGIGITYDQEPLSEFLNLLTEPDVPIVQDFRQSVVEEDDGEYLFCGVSRLDAPGFVEIGLDAKTLKEFYSLGEVTHFVSSSIDVDGLFAVFSDGKRIGGNSALSVLDLESLEFNKIVSARIAGERYLVYAEERNGEVYVGAYPKRSLYKSRFVTLVLFIFVNFIVFLIVFMSLSSFVRFFIVKSVYRINKSLTQITNGNLDEHVSVCVSKEFSELSDGLNTTVSSLKNAMEEIRRRNDEELCLAQRIQAAALPNLEERFGHETAFDVYGANRPMHMVGGDMYDFFRLDQTRFLFYVADVSGHGVAAALVMMKTMGLVKNLAYSGLELTEIVSKTNEYLSENNTTMFVTGFFCILDVSTGLMTYVNAGHNPPLLRRANEDFAPIKPEVNLILGVMANAPYEAAQMQLAPGDDFILYTDGITEAHEGTSENFEMERTLKTLNDLPCDCKAKVKVNSLFDAVDAFTDNAEPSDDETILVVSLKKCVAKH